MRTTILLYGALGKQFGRRWDLDIETPSEAVRAIDALRPGFKMAILELDKVCVGFRVKVNKKAIGAYMLPIQHHGKTITITPVFKGEGGKGVSWGQIILGVVLIVVGIVIAVAGVGITAPGAIPLIMAGAGMIAGGVAGLLTPSPQQNEQKEAKHLPSYQFNGPINTITQGMPVGICYGLMFTGSAVVSAGIEAADMIIASTTGGTDSSGDGGAPGGGGPAGGEH